MPVRLSLKNIFVCICVLSLEVVGPNSWVSLAMVNEMSHCLCLVVTSREFSSVGDIHVEQVFVKPSVFID